MSESRRLGIEPGNRTLTTASQLALNTNLQLLSILSMLDKTPIGSIYQNMAWDEDRYHDLREGPNTRLRSHRLALQIALSLPLDYLQPTDTLIDWGMGEGINYPLVLLPQNLNLIPIEPQSDAVSRGIRAGRIPRSAAPNVITRTTPPYPLQNESVNAALGITAFHVLDKDSMQAVLKDLARVLKTSSVLCHVQAIGPSRKFLYGLDQGTLNFIQEYISQKYQGLDFKLGSMTSADNFWTHYFTKLLEDIQTSNYFHFPDPKNIVGEYMRESFDFSDINLNVNALKVILQQITAHGTTRLKAREIERRIHSTDQIGLVGVLRSTHRLTELMTQLKPEGYTDKMYEALNMFHLGINSLIQDIFEAYLVGQYEAAGLETEASTVSVYAADPVSEVFTFAVEGSGFSVPKPKGSGGSYSRVRKVVGIKK